jgi:hypothetical protein
MRHCAYLVVFLLVSAADLTGREMIGMSFLSGSISDHFGNRDYRLACYQVHFLRRY